EPGRPGVPLTHREGRGCDEHSGAGQRPGPARPGPDRQPGPARPAGRGRAAAVAAGRPDGTDPLRRPGARRMGQRAADVLVQPGNPVIDFEPTDQVFWDNYRDCQHCSYAARTGDQRSVITVTDFYSA